MISKPTFYIVDNNICCKSCGGIVAVIKKHIDDEAFIVEFISNEHAYNVNKTCLHCGLNWL